MGAQMHYNNNLPPFTSRSYAGHKHHSRRTSSPIPGFSFPYDNMAASNSSSHPGRYRRSKAGMAKIVASYVADWAIIVALAAVGYVMGNKTPNKRPFSLTNPDISFPFTEKETVTTTTLVLCNAVAPLVIIAVISLIFVPGSTVPQGTPRSLIWKRKLWELHAGWQGLALSLVAAWFITNGMKNLFGKPRPDLLARCQPDIAHIADYIVGGFANVSGDGQLVSANICTSTDKSTLDDGFRSYPSGHSSSAAAGLIYLSLFIASKFAITIPFLAQTVSPDANAFTAFPSRVRSPFAPEPESFELQPSRRAGPDANPNNPLASPLPSQTKSLSTATPNAHQNQLVLAARRQAAAPPLYLLTIAAIPTFAAVFIASSRWFDFRHHGFDILFGFLIGLFTAIFAFRYYHLPLSRGAGWAWGPRSADKAFWAGVGSFSYATERWSDRVLDGDEEEALGDGGYGVVDGGLGAGNGHKVAGSGAVAERVSRAREEDTGYVGAAR